MSAATRIVILGGGFGGLYAARALAARGIDPERVSVTLVDRERAFVFKPLLYELLTGEVDEADVSFPFEEALDGTGVRFVRGEVGEIDLRARAARLVPEDGRAPLELPFDAAAIALGAESSFLDLPGLAERALAAATLDDFRRIGRRLAEVEAAPGARGRTVAVCGAGPSGVEIACKLASRFRTCRGPPRRIVLVEASDHILPGFGEEVKARALALLREKGVDVRLDCPVRGADDGALLAGGADPPERIPAAAIIWTAGQRPAAPIRRLAVERDAGGRILVPATLEVPGHQGIFALGDAAHCAIEGSEAPPATAQVAVQQAATVARNLLARLEGRTLMSYRYFPLAEALSCGRGYDIFSVLGLKLEGRPAHVARRLAYVARLPGGWRRKAAAGARFGLRFAIDLIGRALPGQE